MGCIWGFIKGILMTIGAITLVIAILIGVFVWQLTQPSGLEAQMHPVLATETAAASFDTKVGELELQLTNATSGDPVMLCLTEEEVTSKIVYELGNAPVDVKEVWVNFTDGKVQVVGKVDVGVELSAGIEIEITVNEDGDPTITFTEIAIGGGFGIPQQAKDAIANAIPSDEALTNMLKDLPVDIETIVIGDGELCFEGVKV